MEKFSSSDKLIFVNINKSFEAMKSNDTASPHYRKSLKECTVKYWAVKDEKARIDGRYRKRRYLGIHKKNDGIDKRLNKSHEHLGQFVAAKELSIWIGSFSHYNNQKEDNIDIVETLFIQAYKDLLTENEKKKKSLPSESVCIINLWFDKKDHLKKYAKKTPEIFSDVLVYYHEDNIFMKGKLSKMR